jgi:predicted transcriptional regulator of viral defense system
MMKGISQKEIKIISDLEFNKKYYFTRRDIARHFKNKVQMRDTLHNLHKKKRIVRLNRDKYFLVPIKARTGVWSDHPFIIADEIFNGEGYFIGGWSAANYWRLTDQIPMRTDVWTTKRQGKVVLMNSKFMFHRTTRKRTGEAVVEHIGNHSFKILSKEKASKWVKGRD